MLLIDRVFFYDLNTLNFEPSPNVKTEKWSNLFVALIGVPVVSEAPNFV